MLMLIILLEMAPAFVFMLDILVYTPLALFITLFMILKIKPVLVLMPVAFASRPREAYSKVYWMAALLL